MLWHLCGIQRTTYDSWLSYSTMQGLGTELRYSGLVASTLITEPSPLFFNFGGRVSLYNLNLLFIPESAAAWIDQYVYYH